MYQNSHHNQSNTMQSLAILDKCTQIIRQDRIWLRNLIKINNQDALLLFKGLPKMPSIFLINLILDMKDLQIKIRKYINRAKQRQKQQQLQRFKENMHLPQFIDQASQKRIVPPQTYNRSQNKQRNPLTQHEPSGTKSSFVAKWNNYTHYNHQNNFMDNRSQLSQISSLSQQDKNLKKQQWSTNYKPHSFNKNLNGQLQNKLSYKNKSTSSIKNNTQRVNFSKQKMYRNNDEDNSNMNYTHGFGQSGRNSSKSLRQLESKIYEELRIFQNNRNNKKESQVLNRTHSQQSVDNYFKQQKPNTNFPQTQKSANLSRQNIDQILKFKLGNCDFQSYKKQIQNQEDDHYQQQQQILRQRNTSNKKLYNQGLFPPIQEQTERDSQSQRYAEQPLRFGLMNSKQQIEDRHKFTFSSFAKASPQLNKSLKANQSLQKNKINNEKQKVAQFYENQKHNLEQSSHPSLYQSSASNNFIHINYEQPLPQKTVSDSLYQSAQKKNDFQEQYLQSNLHKSIMNSIKKSKQQFPSQTFHYYSRASQVSQKGLFNSANYKQASSLMLSHQVLDFNKPQQVISSFQMSNETFGPVQDSSLFTSPELLNQCRNFLKKTQQINFENSGLKNYNNSLNFTIKFDSPLHSHQKSFKQGLSSSNTLHFPQPITITQSITKDFYENQKNSQAKINSLFESKQNSQNKQINIDFQTYSKPLSIFNNQNSYKKSQFLQSSTKKEHFFPIQNIIKSSNKHLVQSQDKYSNSIRQPTSQDKFSNHSRQNNSSFKKHDEIQQTISNSALPTTYQAFDFINNQSSSKSKSNSMMKIQNQSYLPTMSEKNPSNSHKVNQQQSYQPIQSKAQYKTSQFTDLNIHSNRTNVNQQKINNQKAIIQTKPIWNLIQYEDIIDAILQANEGNIQFNSTWLKYIIQNQHIFSRQVCIALKSILNGMLQQQITYNCLQVFQKIEQQYRKLPKYQQRKCPSRDIYLLLDIQQKGFISFDDIKSFIQQLQSAEVQNIQQIKRNLLEVFQSADFMQIQRISYTNLYIIKNQDSFEKLCEDLQQFEFEIQG